MKRLLSQLFASRTRTIRKTARPARRLGLAIETLDQRVLPSATHTLVNGVLTFTADDNGAQVFVIGSSGSLGISGADISSVTSPVSQIVFKGGKGNDTFTEFSSIDSRVIGSAGSDRYFGGAGTNLLDRNGFNVTWQGSTGGTNIVYGLGNGKPTTDDLKATGAMMVSLSSDLSTLTIAGPSGIGFKMLASTGFWFDDRVQDGNGNTFHIFKPSPGASLTLVTGSLLGNLPLPNISPFLSVLTKFEPWSDPVGEYDGITSGPTIPLDTTNSPSLGQLLTFSQDYGLDLHVPSINWALQLGSTLTANDGPMKGAPLDPAVPYFYIAPNFQTGVEVGGYSIQQGMKFSAAFDPSDPFLYGAIQGIPSPEGPIDIAAGASFNGHILFTPQIAPPPDVLGVPVPPPNISANVYLAGIIPLPDAPLAITGSMVVGLVHNVDGTLAAGSHLSSTDADNVIHHTENALKLIQSMTTQPTVGINGELDIGKDFLGGSGIVQMKLGNAVAYYTPHMTNPNPNGLTPADITVINSIMKSTGESFEDVLGQVLGIQSIHPKLASGSAFVFYAQSANPWDGIPIPASPSHTFGQVIHAITDAPLFALFGVVDSQSNWEVDIVALDGSNLFGFSTIRRAPQFETCSLIQKVEIFADIQVPFGLGGTALRGSLDLQTGAIQASEWIPVSFPITLANKFLGTMLGTERLTLSITPANLTGSAVLDIDASGPFQGGPGIQQVFLHGTVTVDANHHASASGSGVYSGGINNGFTGNSFDNNGITIIENHFSWPSDGDLIADGPALVGNPALLHFFVPAGVTEPLHFSAALRPDGLAADYDSASTDPNVSFTFAAPGTYTVYGRMYHADREVEDYQSTVMVYGMDQSNPYFVEKLYHDLLGRASDPTGLSFYTGELAKGITHAQIAASFLHSMEYEQDVVHAAYHDLLGRYAESMGLQGWVSYLQAGHTVTDLRMQIINSPEYAQSHSDDSAFVQSLYQNVLGRTGSQAEMDYYTQVLASVASRADMVQSFFSSPEYRNKLTEDTYQQFLHRDADSAGLWMYTQSLSKGGTDWMVRDSVLSSPEYAPLN